MLTYLKCFILSLFLVVFAGCNGVCDGNEVIFRIGIDGREIVYGERLLVTPQNLAQQKAVVNQMMDSMLANLEAAGMKGFHFEYSNERDDEHITGSGFDCQVREAEVFTLELEEPEGSTDLQVSPSGYWYVDGEINLSVALSPEDLKRILLGEVTGSAILQPGMLEEVSQEAYRDAEVLVSARLTDNFFQKGNPVQAMFLTMMRLYPDKAFRVIIVKSSNSTTIALAPKGTQ